MTVLDATLDVPRPLKLNCEEFLRLGEAGVLDRYAKSELVEGMIVTVNAQYSRHAVAKTRLARRLAEAAPRELEQVTEVAVQLSGDTVVEPDIVLVEGDILDPVIPARQLRLVAEVADSTTAFDLGQKSRLYAMAAVPEYWVVDLPQRQLHRFADPVAEGSWGRTDTVPLGQPVASLTLPDLVIDSADLA